jgi:uncharacterized protein YuzE
MKVRYFPDTDTLYILFHEGEITQSRDMDDDTLVEFDKEGRLCAMTVEHARERADLPHFSFEQIPA